MEVRHHDELSNDERRRRERPIWQRALGVSLVVHALVFLVFPVQSILISPFAAAGPRAGSDRAAAGSMQAMNMQVPPSVPIVPPPIPLPTVENIEPVEFEEEYFEPEAVSGETLGVDDGPGLEDGTGEGDGGTSDEGLFRLVPPVPMLIVPPSTPDDDRVKGREWEVWVFVDASGKVVADSTQLRPPTPNRDFNRSLVSAASEWRFTPARNRGEAVASWFPVKVTVGG